MAVNTLINIWTSTEGDTLAFLNSKLCSCDFNFKFWDLCNIQLNHIYFWKLKKNPRIEFTIQQCYFHLEDAFMYKLHVLWTKHVFMNIDWFASCLIDTSVTKSMFVSLSDTPSSVNETIQQSVKWLNDNILGTHLKPWNAFFSGSGKGQAVIWQRIAFSHDHI